MNGQLQSPFPQPQIMSRRFSMVEDRRIIVSTRKPFPPRFITVVQGTMEVLVFWERPENMLGVDFFRVYLDNESNIVWESNDARSRRARIKIPANTTKLILVSAVNRSTGRESVLIAVQGSSNNDKYVVDGTGGETDGVEGSPPAEWEDTISGGGGVERIPAFDRAL